MVCLQLNNILPSISRSQLSKDWRAFPVASDWRWCWCLGRMEAANGGPSALCLLAAMPFYLTCLPALWDMGFEWQLIVIIFPQFTGAHCNVVCLLRRLVCVFSSKLFSTVAINCKTCVFTVTSINVERSSDLLIQCSDKSRPRPFLFSNLGFSLFWHYSVPQYMLEWKQ